ncbi:MAG TPA: hypothetical protein VGO17_15125 [Aurantimonas sp.]|jgi:phage protein U|nr:hypothetical protein [Aurantimonas sp.]
MALQTVASIGRAQLRVIGLNPQRIAVESESRVTGAPTWKGMDYQLTGRGEKRTQIEARTAPHVFGGLDALGWLIRHHQAQDVVNYIRLGSNFAATLSGAVVIRTLFYDESKLHPFDGVGRIVEVEIDLVHVGEGR